jgi:glycerophosphoryl diester phosphodiesterase
MFITGHRGARAAAPENTLAAIRIGMGCADFVEVDARLTRDRVPVVIHDATLERTTSGRGPVASCSLEDLLQLDAGSGEHIPSLREVCDLVREIGEGCGLFVEIKDPGSEDEVFGVLREAAPRPLWVVSFHASSVAAAKHALSQATAGLIYSRALADPLGAAASAGAGAILPRFDLLLPGLAVQAHDQGLLVVPWVLNRPEEWERAVEYGVDGFATDDPCRAAGWMKKEISRA